MRILLVSVHGTFCAITFFTSRVIALVVIYLKLDTQAMRVLHENEYTWNTSLTYRRIVAASTMDLELFVVYVLEGSAGLTYFLSNLQYT